MIADNNEILEVIRTCDRAALPQVIGAAIARLLAPPVPAATKAQPIDEWLSVGEASALLKVSKSFLYHADRHGITPRRIGKKLLFSRRELMAQLEHNGGQ